MTSTQDIHSAAVANDVAQVSALLKKNPDLVNARDENGMTPLMAAAERGHQEVCERLIASGADVNAHDDYWTTLYLAAHPGPYKRQPAMAVVNLLLANGVADDIFAASILGNADHVAELLTADSSLANARDAIGITPLYLAVWNNHKAVVELLLINGADVNAKSRGDHAAMDTAVMHEYRDVVELLVARGAECDIFVASRFGLANRVAELLKADPTLANAEDERGQKPLRIAKVHCHKNVIELLLANGAEDPGDEAARFLRGEVIERRNMAGTMFHDLNLAGAVFNDINLAGASFHNVNLSNVSIEYACVDGLIIWGFNIRELIEAERNRRASG